MDEGSALSDLHRKVRVCLYMCDVSMVCVCCVCGCGVRVYMYVWYVCACVYIVHMHTLRIG